MTEDDGFLMPAAQAPIDVREHQAGEHAAGQIVSTPMGQSVRSHKELTAKGTEQ